MSLWENESTFGDTLKITHALGTGIEVPKRRLHRRDAVLLAGGNNENNEHSPPPPRRLATANGASTQGRRPTSREGTGTAIQRADLAGTRGEAKFPLEANLPGGGGGATELLERAHPSWAQQDPVWWWRERVESRARLWSGG